MNTPTTEPTAIPPRIQDQLTNLERIRHSHPDVLAHASSIRFGDTKLIVHWSSYATTQAEMQAFAASHPEAEWKPKAAIGSHDLDWVGNISGVTVELSRAQSLPLERLPDRVDLQAIKSTLTNPIAGVIKD
jgi:hypothetical protein